MSILCRRRKIEYAPLSNHLPPGWRARGYYRLLFRRVGDLRCVRGAEHTLDIGLIRPNGFISALAKRPPTRRTAANLLTRDGPKRSTVSDNLIMLWYLRSRPLQPLLPCNRTAGSTELGTMEFIYLEASGYEVGRCRISIRFLSSRTISNCAAP
jgi:hypothetical protein